MRLLKQQYLHKPKSWHKILIHKDIEQTSIIMNILLLTENLN